jgi:vacuolar-type H+-ATPase subunit E/Vma4
MSSDMTVGKVYSTTTTHPSGITEVLLEKAQRERDHYKSALEEISTSVDDWLNSLIQEPSLDFIHAIKAYAQKKLNEI